MILQTQHQCDAKSQPDIIARCIAGDEAAFKSMYDQYVGAMYNTAYRILNNQADSEDIIQESFLDAFKNISGFENRAAFSTWLKRIVIHKCVNTIKKKKLMTVELREDSFENIAGEDEYDEEQTQWEVHNVLKGIEMLPDHYRPVVNLYLIEGYDHEEIAQITEIPEATVRTQYSRGKKKLVEIIKNNFNK